MMSTSWRVVLQGEDPPACRAWSSRSMRRANFSSQSTTFASGLVLTSTRPDQTSREFGGDERLPPIWSQGGQQVAVPRRPRPGPVPLRHRFGRPTAGERRARSSCVAPLPVWAGWRYRHGVASGGVSVGGYFAVSAGHLCRTGAGRGDVQRATDPWRSRGFRHHQRARIGRRYRTARSAGRPAFCGAGFAG